MSDERLRVTRVPVGRMKTEDVLTMLAADFRESEHREISTALFRHAEDVASMRAERDRLRAALEELRAAVRMHDCRGSHKMRLIIDRALNPEPTT